MYFRQAARPLLPTTMMGIPDGSQGTVATLNVMARFARAGRQSELVRDAANELTAGLAQKDFVGEIRAIQEFVRDRIRYLRDPVQIERVQTPEATLTLKSGDCDDKSVLTAALLESVGHPARFKAVGPRPGMFSHVFVQAQIYAKGGIPKWINVETTEPWELGRPAPTALPYFLIRNVK